MTARTLVDTNVLVYSYDRSEPAKQQRALETIEGLSVSAGGAVSTQVLAEFFTTAIRKLPAPLSIEDAAGRVSHYLRTWTVFDVTSRVVEEAVHGVRDYRLNYWDAQLWAVARLHDIPLVLSEDFSDGQVLGGVRFLNPFQSAFRLAGWL